jgi:hypothetical protein
MLAMRRLSCFCINYYHYIRTTMNQLFTLRRFGLLLKLDFASNGKKYLITASVVTGAMLLMMNPMMDLRKLGFDLMFMHTMGLWVCLLGSSLFTSSMFTQYHEPTRGIAALMVPASQTEKFLARLLVNFLFVAFFLATFWAFHYWFMTIVNSSQVDGAKYRSFPPNAVKLTNYVYFLIQSSVFLGSIYFTKNAYIKTIAVFLIALASTFFLNLMVVVRFADRASHVDTAPFAPWTIWLENPTRVYAIRYPEPMVNVVWTFVILMLIALLYIAFVRLKEKEI